MSDTQTTSAQAACGCWTGPWWGTNQPPRCHMHTGGFALAAPNGGLGPKLPMAWTGLTKMNLAPPRLSDDDVERIARRVAELLKAT